MNHFFYYFVLATGMIYAAVILYFYRGLQKLRPIQLKPNSDLPLIGVVVAARNEEAHIEETVRSLANQNYPKDRYSIVVVDDRSEDKTLHILRNLEQEIENLQVMDITEKEDGISPKKRALLKAVNTLDVEFVATTDADCVHHSDWLCTYASAITPDLGVATGMTVYHKDSYRSQFEKAWQTMQGMEYISEHLVGAGAIGYGLAFYADGANMMFNRELYQEAGREALQSHITSGDDFFLIQTARKRNYKLKFVINDTAIVRTVPEDTIGKVINQRARWASKVGDGSAGVTIFSVNTFLFYSGILLYPITLLSGTFNPLFFSSLVALKIIPDTAYMLSGYNKLKMSLQPLYYSAMQILHIPFVFVAVLKGILVGFHWKGTKYKK